MAAGSAGATPADTRREAIEARAACITHEGADLPMAGGAALAPLPSTPRAGCSAGELDGTACEALAEAEAVPCRAREIAVWDGVLDRLARESKVTRRLAAAAEAIRAFRLYRDRTCTAFRSVAVNPGGPGTVEACRLSETARFAQRLYEAVYSP